MGIGKTTRNRLGHAVAWLLTLALSCTAPAQATADFPAEPILRLNPEGHLAQIYRIDTDTRGRWLVSGADDKTVKVWRLADGTLERTLRIPQGEGNLGKVHALAISPDGARVAAGGWTGSADGLNTTIYIFDRATGALEHRIQGLPNVIKHLAYAPDGERLAATLFGANGMRLYRTDDYREIARDTDYGNSSFWGDFAADGRLVTSSYDGKLRLYRHDGSLDRSAAAPGGERPFGVAFAPDGTRVALGYSDSTRVDVLDATTLALRYTADTGGADNDNLISVAWSADGKTLLAGGTYDVGGWRPILRWSDGGRGTREELRVTTSTVMDLRPLPDGRLAVGAADKVALLTPGGETAWERPNATADFRNQLGDKGIRLSGTGDRVAFGYEQWGKRPALFSLRERTLTLDPTDLADLTPPDEGPREGLAVTDWKGTFAPKLNGEPLALQELETSRRLAIAPDGERFVLGADYRLRAYAPKPGGWRKGAQKLWQQPVPGVVWAVNISGDGRYAVAGYIDGTLRWHRMEDGVEVLALYPHPDGKRWVLWTPRATTRPPPGARI